MAANEPNLEKLVQLLFEYSAKIAEEKDLERLLVIMADLGKELVVCDRCTLWLVDNLNQELWTKVAHGIESVRMPLDKGIAGEAVSKKVPIIINDPYNDCRFNPDVDKKTGYSTESMIVVPIINSLDEIIGVYQAINKKTDEKEFHQSDVERLQMTATYSGKSLESAILYSEIESTQRDLVHILGEVGESRSRETGNHVKRVGEYSYILAKALGMGDDECELVRLSAPLHDIGKVAIPDAILNKPGKLTFEEFETMKTHAAIGGEFLKKSPRKILRAAAIMAEEHQEKFNGYGYPHGLKGEEIHIYGRICAVADVFDALGCDRCYKKAWPEDKVLQLFREERGEHFDPVLVDLFFENLDEFRRVQVELKDEFEGDH
jgi:response regulator RpfG family c-di-GMP phosphodiesterase